MFHKEKSVKAKKEHQCSCCYSQINKGDFYMKMEFVDLGKMGLLLKKDENFYVF